MECTFLKEVYLTSNDKFAKKTNPYYTTIPQKNQGIILNVNDNMKLGNYIVFLANIIEPKNILLASTVFIQTEAQQIA